MNELTIPSDAGEWVCARCNQPLAVTPVTVTYLGSAFPVDLLRCKNCGLILISEDLALGKMAEVERTLEDK